MTEPGRSRRSTGARGPRVPRAWRQAVAVTEAALRDTGFTSADVAVAVESLCADPDLLRHPDLGRALARLARLLDGLGLRSSSRALLERAVARLDQDWGESSTHGATLNPLAVTLADRGDLSAAATVVCIAVEAETRHDADAASVRSLVNLAAIRLRLDAFPEAAEAAVQALERMPPEGTGGEAEGDLEARFLATAVMESAARHQNLDGEADRLLDDLEAIARRLVDLLGGQHPKSLSALVALASAEFGSAQAAGDHDRMERASDVLAVAAQKAAATAGAHHPQAVAALMSLAAVEGDAAWHTRDRRRLARARSLTAVARERAEALVEADRSPSAPEARRPSADTPRPPGPPRRPSVVRTPPTRAAAHAASAGGDPRTSALAAGTASSHAMLEEHLRYRLDTALLTRALTHRSYAYEHGGLPPGERLAFLGDSVLGLIITDRLYRTHPGLSESGLAKLRAAVLNSVVLAGVARGLDLGSFVLLGRGEELTGGRDRTTVLADALEAVIGAVYLDQGIDAASELVHRLFDPLMERSSKVITGTDRA